MPLEVFTQRITVESGDGTIDVTKSGFGTPVAIFVFGTPTSTDTGVTAPGLLSTGFADGTTQHAVCGRIDDNVGTTNTRWWQDDGHCGLVYSEYHTRVAFSAWITDGVRLSRTWESTYGDCTFTVVVFGGSGVSAETGYLSDPDSDISDMGFDPDLVLIYSWGGAAGYEGDNYNRSFGLAVNGTNGVKNYNICHFARDAQTTDIAAVEFNTSECASSIWETTMSTAIAFQTGGFTSSGGGTNDMQYLAIYGGGASLDVQILTAKTSTGTQAYSGYGFQPDFLIGMAAVITATDTSDQLGDGASDHQIFVSDGTLTYSHGIIHEDAASTTDADSFQAADIRQYDYNAHTTPNFVATVDSLDSDGFTLDFTTASAASKWWALGIGPPPPNPLYRGSTTAQSASATALSPTIPGAAVEGDLLIAFCCASDNVAARVWDDDGGGSNGWTRHRHDRTTAGRDRETAIYYKIHGASESTPTFTLGGTAGYMSASITAWWQVDDVTPFDVTEQFAAATNDSTPTPPAITTSTDNSRVVVMSHITHDDITTAAPPSGYSPLHVDVSGSSRDHRQQTIASKVVGTAGTETPGAWTHTVTLDTAESHSYTLALRYKAPAAAAYNPHYMLTNQSFAKYEA